MRFCSVNTHTPNLHSFLRPVGLLAASLAIVSSASALALPPERVEVTYEVRYNDILFAELTEIIEHHDGRYTIASDAKGRGLAAALPVGPFKQSSRGTITKEGLRPDEYRDQRSSRISIAEFDWGARTLKLSDRGKSETRSLEGFVHDRLSFAFTFAFTDIPQASVRMSITDGRGVSESRFTIAREESVKTPLGDMPSIKATKNRDEPNDPFVEVWLAKGHYHLPVRMVRIDKDGTRFDQVITRIQPSTMSQPPK